MCACVCVYVGGRKEIKRERVREGEASSVYSPPFSLPVSLSLHPSSPVLDHPPALLQARPGPPPPTTQTTPGPFDSPHFSVPPSGTSEQVRPGLFQPALRLVKSTSCPLLSSSSALVFVFFALTCLCSLLAFPPFLYAYFKFPLQHFCPSQKSDTVAGDDISEVTVFFLLPLIFHPDINFPLPIPEPQSLRHLPSCLLQSHTLRQIQCESESSLLFFKSARSTS